MCRVNRLFTVQTFLLINICCVGLGFGQRDKFLGGLIDYLNNLPNQPYVYEDGLLLSSRNEGENIYKLEVSLKASDVHDPKSFKLLRCTATVHDNGDSGVTVQENQHQCHEDIVQPPAPGAATLGLEEAGEDVVNTDALLQEVPVKLDNEVQSDTAVTSGEQFVAIPRYVPNAPCIGCSSHVNTTAPGVHELALLGVRHLDRHDPNVRHNLKRVLEVERQVQVVNGVRYILALKIAYDNCTISGSDGCSGDRTCKISILEKPWVKLPDGSKFRAILANNCTENWLFGDDGEVLPPEDKNHDKNNINSIDDHEKHDHGSNEDFFKEIYQTDTQAKPVTERTLSEHDVKLLEDQIIPKNYQNTAELPRIKVTTEPNIAEKEKNALQKEEISARKTIVNDNDSKNVQEDQKNQDVNNKLNTLSDKKKKDIDELLSFLNYANLDPKQMEKESTPRMRRSFDYDLKLLDLAEMYKNIKNQVAEGKTMVTLGEFLVNYMNEMDIEMKTRVLKDVLKAEEEFDNDKQFVYIQARVYIPCGKLECDSNENVTNICNAIIDSTDINSPQMLNYFCYEEKINKQSHGKVTMIPLDDPVLQNLADDVLMKMEGESDIPNAMNLRVLEANTRKTVGIVTEISVETVFTNCNKTIPRSLRDNCTALENIGSNICEVVIVDRSWLNEKQISYTCTKRSVDESISSVTNEKNTGNMKNPKILAMAQLALRHLEERSNIDYRQKIVDVTKVSTQLVAGLLTNLEFVVGYTKCLHSDSDFHPENCKLYNDLPLRNCIAQIWDRSWLIDGKQVKVTCDDRSTIINDLNNNEISRKKRDLGGESEQDLNKEEYQILANDAMKLYVQKSGGLSAVVTKVIRVTTQVVEGIKTKIDFEILKDSSIKLVCHASVLEPPGLKNKKIDVNCKETTRQKRFLAGGIEEKDANDPKYRVLAEDSLQKYLTQTKLSGVWKVAEVSKVTYQLVSGSLTDIDFTISNNKGASLPCHSEIWEQPWLKKKDIKVNCLETRELFGGTEESDQNHPKHHVSLDTVKEKDPNDPKYQILAEDALQKYVTQEKLSGVWKVTKVTKVTNQVVAGSLTAIDFIISNNKGAALACHSEIWEQPWLKKKEIKVDCQVVKETRGLLGGPQKKNASDPKYQILARESLQKYVNQSKLSGVWTVAKVSKVTSQVVSGIKTNIDFTIANNKGASLPCHSEIWEQPWLKKKDIKVECQLVRDTDLFGVKHDDPNDSYNLATLALQKYLSQSNLQGRWRVFKVLSNKDLSTIVKKLYFIITPNYGKNTMRCNAWIKQRSWIKKKHIKVFCFRIGGARDMGVGGPQDANTNDSEYRELAEDSLQKFMRQTKLSGVWKVAKVNKVTYRVVAGSLINIDFTILNNKGVSLPCHSEVLEQAWLKKKDINVECQVVKETNDLMNGTQEKDPNDPIYQILAEESLHHYVSQVGLTEVWKLTKVTKVTNQLVPSGSLTEIYFKTENNKGESSSCHSAIAINNNISNNEFDVKCTNLPRRRLKRTPGVVIGGEQEQNPNKNKYKQLAKEAVNEYLQQSINQPNTQVTKVLHVTTQVAEGIKTKIEFEVLRDDSFILICHALILERPWLVKKDFDVACSESRRVAGTFPGNISDPRYLKMASKSLEFYYREIPGMKAGKWKIANITLVLNTRDPVKWLSGIWTEVYFTANNDGDRKIGLILSCVAKIWEMTWLKREDIFGVDCWLDARRNHEEKGPAAIGRLKEQNPQNPKYLNLAKESFDKYVRQSGSPGEVTKILHVASQVGAGIKTTMYFQVIQNGSKDLICKTKVLEQAWLGLAWLNNKNIEIDCFENDKQRRKKTLRVVGGKTEQDPKYPKYQVLAEKSLQKHVSQKGLAGVWKVAEVTKVTYQVVSGSSTEIDFTVTENGGQQLSCHSKVWEQPWLNKEEIVVDCKEAGRQKRELGGIKEENPKEPKYQILAEESLQKHVSEKGLNGVWKVTEVTKVTYQVVSGSLTRVDFRVAERDGQVLFCHSEVREQPWLNKKEITVECDEMNREKRQVPGGQNEQDPKDPKYQILAEESLQKHVSQTGLTGAWKVAEVTKVTEQVVEGHLTEIDFKVAENGGQVLICHSKILEQPWLNIKKIEVECRDIVREQRKILGGKTDKDPKDRKYQVLAEKSLQKHMSQKGLAGVWKVAEVTKVTYQVVSGSSTEIDFTVVENGGQQLSCHSKVWEQPWLNKEEIVVDCKEAGRQKRELGGIKEKNPKEPKYQILAEESLQKHVSEKGLNGVWKVTEVTKVTYQVVSGSLTRVDFRVAERDGQVLFCHSEVREQPWLNKKEITVECDEMNREKRQVPGGQNEQDPKDPKYQILAEESLQKHVSQTGLTGAWKVAEVTKVTEQVVEGHLTEIDFKVGENGGQVLICHSKILEQPWLNIKKIEVECRDIVREQPKIRGGKTDKDPKDCKYQVLAEKSLQKHVSQKGLAGVWKVAEVTKVTYQVVSGSSTEIDFTVVENGGQQLSCHSKVWEQPWLNKEEIVVDCKEAGRQKRELGGIKEENPKEPKYQILAEESLQKHVSEKGLNGVWKVTEVTKVTYQVVSGSLTRVDFKVAERDGQVLFCHSEVREQPWLNKKEITVECDEMNREIRQVPGGQNEQDPKDLKYQILAEESLQKHVSQTGLTGAWKVAEVTKVTEQVVEGHLTEIDFKVAENGGQVLICHSKILEQPWLNIKKIEVECRDIVREQRKIIGGKTDKDPKDRKYQVLAEKSLQKHMSQKGLAGVWKVAEVTKVTYQVVSGSSTEIDFTVVENGGQQLSCHSKVWEQPWLNKEEIVVDCKEAGRQKRKLGGIKEENPKEPKYQILAEESLQKHVSEKGLNGVWKVTEVTKVTYQVVSGSLTRVNFKVAERDGQVLFCHSEVWEQPWLKKKEITVECDEMNREKRQVPGGQNEQDPKDRKYQVLAEKSLQKHVSQKGLAGVWKVAEVTKVTYLVVSGSSTEIDFTVTENGGQKLSCHSKVWEQPWLNKEEIVVDCKEAGRQKRKLGGIKEENPKELKYQILAEESLQKHVSEKGLNGVWKVTEVTKVTYQVVSGSLTRVNFKVAERDGQVLFCHSEVWEQPWLKKKEITVECDEMNREKQQVPGGQNEQDPKDPKYQILADESLQKHVSQTGLTGAWKVAEVTKVTDQVVEGHLTEIDFKVAESSGQVLICHSKILEQPWLNIKKIEVECRDIVREQPKILGGKTDKDPKDRKYQVLAEKSLQKHVLQKGLAGVWKVAEVTKVTYQVVSGSSTEIDFTVVENGGQQLSCHSKVWEQPWRNKQKIVVDCHRNEQNTSDAQKNEHRQLAQKALVEYDKDSDSKYSHKVLKLSYVYGYNISEHVTVIDFTMATTKCLRTDDGLIKRDCEVDTSTKPFICHAVIENGKSFTQCMEKKAKDVQEMEDHHEEWLNTDERVKKSKEKPSDIAPPMTSDARFKRQIRPDDYDIDDDVKFLYAEKAIDDLNLRSDTQNMQKLVAIHSAATSMQMGTQLVRMYIEVGYTFCLKQHKPKDMSYCDELDGLNHRLCLVKVYPTPQDDTVVKHVTTVCDDEADFELSSGLNVLQLIKASLNYIEKKENLHYKIVHQGEPNMVPSLDTSEPIKLSFIVATTNCSKNDVSDIYDYARLQQSLQQKDCIVLESIHPKACSSFIWMSEKSIKHIKAVCRAVEPATRFKRSTDGSNERNSTSATVEELVNESIHKLEMSNIYKFKQRVLQINSYNTKITSGKLTTIDFDVGYTSCLKYEWVDDMSKCEFLEHLPRRHCVSMIYERLWVANGKKIHVNCEDDETPLEVHTEFENAQLATSLSEEALKHIEFKYPHPQRQKVVRIFSVEQQKIAGLHYRVKLEVGFTDCLALSVSTDCNLAKDKGDNKFCRANIWVRPWTDHPPTVRVVCDYQEAATTELYHQVQAEHLFYDFITTHKPAYLDDPVEMGQRFQIFKANVRKIHELNTREKGTARYAVTQFADLSYEEFFRQYLGLKPGLRSGNQVPLAPAQIPSYEIPAGFDWREHGAVTPVKNQGSCGSCWAFSVTGNIEGQYKLQTGKLLSLSEQELVDCDKLDQGCNGGMPDNAYRAIEALGGLEAEDDYPYEGENDKCSFNKKLAKVQLSGAVNISSNETDMAKWLVQNGPISIGINANAMQFYVGGISHPWKMLCNPNNIDHGVLIVGYGVKSYPLFNKVLPYWIVKNSWGASWGEQGYYRVFRGDGTCGVNTLASSAILAFPYDEY